MCVTSYILKRYKYEILVSGVNGRRRRDNLSIVESTRGSASMEVAIYSLPSFHTERILVSDSLNPIRLHILADRGDMAPRQLKMRAPNKGTHEPSWEGKCGLAPVADSRSIVLSALAIMGVVEVSVIGDNGLIDDPTSAILEQYPIRDLRGTSPHRDHQSAHNGSSSVLHFKEVLLHKSIVSLNPVSPRSWTYLEHMPQRLGPPTTVAFCVRQRPAMGRSRPGGHRVASYLYGVYIQFAPDSNWVPSATHP